jgi:hypothetical protein
LPMRLPCHTKPVPCHTLAGQSCVDLVLRCSRTRCPRPCTGCISVTHVIQARSLMCVC